MAFRAATPVLRGLCLQVTAGEIVALVGASGSGKSTLLRSIAGLIQPAQGQIEIQLHQVGNLRRVGDLAYVFQDATLLPWRTLDENIGLPLELGRSHGGHDLRRAVDQARQSVGLDRASGRKFPRELSGGMRMRASIARALVTDPDVLLLDEPFAALDDILRSKLNDLLLELWDRRPRTIVFVTHNIAEAVYLSHRVVVMGGGRVAKALDNPLAWPRQSAHRGTLPFANMYSRVSQELAEVVES